MQVQTQVQVQVQGRGRGDARHDFLSGPAPPAPVGAPSMQAGAFLSEDPIKARRSGEKQDTALSKGPITPSCRRTQLARSQLQPVNAPPARQCANSVLLRKRVLAGDKVTSPSSCMRRAHEPLSPKSRVEGRLPGPASGGFRALHPGGAGYFRQCVRCGPTILG